MTVRLHASRTGLLVSLLLCGLALAANAQTGGVITGTISDVQNGALPGVTVTVRNTESGLARTAVTGGDGTYRFGGLPPGLYDLSAELPGFSTAEVKGQTLTVGAELRANVTLRLENLQESIIVSGQAPIVEVTKSDVAGVITQQQIETLPVGTRQTLTLALLMPGTNADESRPRRVSVSVGAGGRVSSSSFLVDGVSNQQSTGGDPRQDFPQGAIREFRINVSQAKAEFGGTTGGVVSIVTKSGTNLFSGEAFEFFRDKTLNRMNQFEQQRHEQLGTAKPDFRRHQYGATLGGPIVKDRLQFLVAGDLTETTDFVTVNTGKPQFYSSIEGTASNDQFRRMFFGRADIQLGSTQNAFARWGWERDYIECQSCGGSTAATSGTSVQQRRNSLVSGHTWVLSPRVLNEFRFQWAPFAFLNMAADRPIWTDVGNFSAERFKLLTPVYVFPSATWGSSSTKVQLETWWDFRDDVSFTVGNHASKVGVASIRDPGNEDLTGSGLGTWTFGADQPFDPTSAASLANLTNPIQFTASFPPVEQPYNSKWLQAYAQDDWRLSSKLTLNLGVRYDLQYGSFNQHLDLARFPKPIPYIDPASRGDRNNLQPRFGAAWDPLGNGHTVVRGAYGLYNRYQWTGVFSSERQNLIQTSVVVRNPSYPDPYGGKDPLTFASTAAPNITIVANNLRNPLAHIATVGVSRELMANMAVNVDAVYTKTRRDNISANINTQDPVTKLRPLPEWGRIIQNQSAGESEYKALLVRAEKRLANRTMYLVSYTLAKSRDNGSATITDAYNPGLEWGPGNTDRLHTLVSSGAVLLPLDVTLGGVWTIRSSMPFSARAGRDLNNDGATTDYVPGTTRNTGNRVLDLGLVNAWRASNGLGSIALSQIDSNRYNSVDLRLSKSFDLGVSRRKIELVGQVFNVFGTTNLLASGGNGAWVDNALSDSFGRILTAFNRQQGEVAVRFAW
jgi:carboxypeptidase family protein